jgi:phage baseplate assembly protein V
MWVTEEDVVRICTAMLAQYGQHKYGTVTGVNPDGSHTAKVTFQPEGVTSSWLPVLTPQIGVTNLPMDGDQVLVAPTEGNTTDGVIIGGVYSDLQRAPLGKSGEVWAVNRTTQDFMTITNDGKISMSASTALNMSIKDGTIAATGTITLSATKLIIAANTEFTGTIKSNGVPIDSTHVHTEVSTGTDNTGPPFSF